MNKYEVSLKSVPGMYAQYSGSVTVWAEDEDEAVEEALSKLKRGAFPDRSRSMWRIVDIKKVRD